MHHHSPFTLYLVTDPDLAGGSNLVPGIVVKAVRGGVTCVQIRDKHGSDEEVASCALATRAALAEAGYAAIPIFVNDRLDVAREHGFHLHVGQTDAPYVQSRATLSAELMVGLSVGSLVELDESLKRVDAAGVRPPDVLGIGPVWQTPTKTDAGEGIGPDTVAEIARIGRARGIASVAIGGIHADTVAQVYGVDGICVVSEIMGANDPMSAAATLLHRASGSYSDR